MKTERRHELQTNQLADSLARLIESAKPYSRAGLALLVAIVVVVFAWFFMAHQSNSRVAQGWDEYFAALEPSNRDAREQLNDISVRYAGTPVAEWARLVLADLQLDNGTNQLLVQKKDARDELRQAAEKYRGVLLEARLPAVRQQATFGLARAHEALGTPDSLEEARKEYRSIGQQWPDCAYAAAGESRANDLDQASTKNFYDWLAKYEPPAPLTKEPGIPGARPEFLKDSLDDGVKLPSATDGAAAPATTDQVELGGEEAPAGSQPPTEPLTAPSADAAGQDAAPADKPAASPADNPPSSNGAAPESK
ncbi:MAG TPA: hypothetical protein VHV08_16015 [Pirellulales bacterium]|jgi:hypothetical protein|nr:hypothetical protein [Pirellulales bacterium]